MTVETIFSMYLKVSRRLEILEREKQEKQQADELKGRQQPVEMVGNRQPHEAVEKQHHSINDSCDPIDFNTIPKVIIFFINSKVVVIKHTYERTFASVLCLL
jgi:hypothetical protein